MELEYGTKQKCVWKSAAAAGARLPAADVLWDPLVIWNIHRLRQAALAVEGDSVPSDAPLPFEYKAGYTFGPFTSKREIEAELGSRSGRVGARCAAPAGTATASDTGIGSAVPGPAQQLLSPGSADFAVLREAAIVRPGLQQQPG